MTFTDQIYGSWMGEIQEKKYEGIYMDFITPSSSLLDLESAKMLDVGVGKGWFEEFLTEKGVEPEMVVGVDTTERHTPFPFVLAEGDYLPFPDGAFDVVVSLDTLHMLEGVHELVRVTREGGILLVSDFCNQQNMEGKRAKLLKSFDDLKLLKEGVVGGEREMDYVAMFRKR